MGWGREGGTPGGGMVNRALLSCICFTKWSVPCLQTMKFLLQKLSKFVLEAAGKTVPSENITEKVARELPPNFPRKNLLVLGGGGDVPAVVSFAVFKLEHTGARAWQQKYCSENTLRSAVVCSFSVRFGLIRTIFVPQKVLQVDSLTWWWWW